MRKYDMLVAKLSSLPEGLYDKFDQPRPYLITLFISKNESLLLICIYCSAILRSNIKIVIDEKYWTIHFKIDLNLIVTSLST